MALSVFVCTDITANTWHTKNILTDLSVKTFQYSQQEDDRELSSLIWIISRYNLQDIDAYLAMNKKRAESD